MCLMSIYHPDYLPLSPLPALIDLIPTAASTSSQISWHDWHWTSLRIRHPFGYIYIGFMGSYSYTPSPSFVALIFRIVTSYAIRWLCDIRVYLYQYSVRLVDTIRFSSCNLGMSTIMSNNSTGGLKWNIVYWYAWLYVDVVVAAQDRKTI